MWAAGAAREQERAKQVWKDLNDSIEKMNGTYIKQVQA